MFDRLAHLWKRRRGLVLLTVAVILSAAGFGVVRLGRSAPRVPTAEVKRGEFVDYVQVRAEVKALKSISLVAPSGAGDVQIVDLAANGAQVKKDDMVARFDPSSMQRNLDQRRSELKQSDAEIERTRAQGHLQEEQTQTDLLKAQYDVERARLEASKSEILSQIEGEKAKVALANVEQKLFEVQERLRNDRLANQADIAARTQRREKAVFEVRQAEGNLEKLVLRAPSHGMVTLLQNWRAGRGFGVAPEWRPGDRAWSGAAIAELPDLSTIRVNGRIDESDRGRLRAGQSATVRVDALPDKEFSGRVAEISPLAKLDFSGWPPSKNFDLAVELSAVDARLRPGMSATTRVAVDRIPDSILVPVEAVFQKFGRSVVYVLRGSNFEERVVQVARRSPAYARISGGLEPGQRVALKDPTLLTETPSQ